MFTPPNPTQICTQVSQMHRLVSDINIFNCILWIVITKWGCFPSGLWTSLRSCVKVRISQPRSEFPRIVNCWLSRNFQVSTPPIISNKTSFQSRIFCTLICKESSSLTATSCRWFQYSFDHFGRKRIAVLVTSRNFGEKTVQSWVQHFPTAAWRP